MSLLSTLKAAERVDWPQWRGPERTGTSRETGLLASWPEAGPKVLWKIENLGPAYSAVSVARGRVLTQGNRESREEIISLNLENGEIVWAVSPNGKTTEYHHNKGDGPRGSVTIDGDEAFVEGGSGIVSCLDFATGRQIWAKSLVSDFGGDVPRWGYSESPLVDGNQVIVTPGGSEGAIVALDRKNGNIIWQSADITDAAHYSSAIRAEVAGVPQYIQFTNSRVIGVTVDAGKLLWEYREPANKTANVATPVFQEDMVFASSAYGTGGGAVKLTRQDDKFKAEPLYFEKSMANHHGGVVLVDGYLYGFGSNALICMDFKTGKVMWQNRSVGKGSLTYADGHLYCLGENQELALVKASPQEYVETGRMELPDSGKPSWTHPVVAQGRLFIRDQGALTCYDISDPGSQASISP